MLSDARGPSARLTAGNGQSCGEAGGDQTQGTLRLQFSKSAADLSEEEFSRQDILLESVRVRTRETLGP